VLVEEGRDLLGEGLLIGRELEVHDHSPEEI
jgi:hypothetical protein